MLNLISLCVMGIMIVGGITVNDEYDEYDEYLEGNDEIETQIENKDIYEQILKSMEKYNLQYNKFYYNNILKENLEKTNSKSYIASAPIPIPHSNKKGDK